MALRRTALLGCSIEGRVRATRIKALVGRRDHQMRSMIIAMP
jgi:hypothetical protein